MGSGRWSTDVYTAAANYRARSGKSAFDYSDSGARTAHPALDPKNQNRESRDSEEHPFSTPIAVIFDVTGSMGHVPRALQTKLPQLLGLLTRKGYATDPHLLFGAVGDATCDRVPLQIGQFESDNRMDDDLARIVLEGGGGGQKRESYELAMYFMARHTSLDATKRGRRGYLFLIGDEMPYPKVSRKEVKRFLGEDLREQISTEDLLAELQRKYDVYYLMPSAASWGGDREILARWRGLLGQNVLELDDLDAVCETIAVTVGLGEDTIDLDEGLSHLVEAGSKHGGTVGKALAPLQRGTVVRSSLTIGSAGSGNERL
ncbi:hypothetical protein [Actinoplanes sp. NPDC048796]|uniref:hypothetical protein n=1 Tax=unclassified Actinoplanes TaxID=2626549 RepID=UPI0033F7C88A